MNPIGNPFVQFFFELQKLKTYVPLSSKILIIKDSLEMAIEEYEKVLSEKCPDENTKRVIRSVISGAKQTLKDIKALDIEEIEKLALKNEQLKNIKQ